MNRNWSQLLIWLLKANLAVWLIDSALLAVLALLGFDALSLVYAGYFSKILLLEAGILFLIGGAIAFSSGLFPSKVREHVLRKDEDWSVEKLKKGEKKANQYILVGVLLFVQSLIVSVLAI